NSNFVQEKKRIQEKDYCDTLCARDWKDPKCIQVGNLDIKGQDSIKRVYSIKWLSPTLTNMQGGNRQPKIEVIGQASNEGSQAGMIYSDKGISPSLCARTHGYAMGNIKTDTRIRKLTPKECWRLMGFSDEDFEKAADIPTSNTQLYKQAGNSIVVKVLEKIFKQLLTSGGN
ncbi:MAG: DNA cytosine methyltransferase, partial [Clostridia bacterium]|nr:DNA cytosine methyltransferase [Clostridia bacterium]